MHENFVSRYKTICLQPTPEQLKNRFDGIEDICKEEEFDVSSLVRLFYELPVDENFKKEFSDYFFNKDITFEKSNSREIAYLAGETLLEMLENDYCSKLIILSVLSISLLKNNTLIPEIRSIALNKLDEVCSQIREDGKIDIEDINEINLDELENELQGQTVKIEYMLKIIEHIKTINDNMVNIYNNQELLCSSIDAYKEETNILSWLIGETSNDLHKKLDKKIMQREVAFILGKELADLVLIIPGPYSAKGILNKMVGLCKAESKKLSLVDMVDLIDKNWKVSLLKKYPVSAYYCNTPIILAIAKSLEVDGDKVWKYTYGKIMGFDPETVTKDMLTWGYQIYLECLLVKLSEEYNG